MAPPDWGTALAVGVLAGVLGAAEEAGGRLVETVLGLPAAVVVLGGVRVGAAEVVAGLLVVPAEVGALVGAAAVLDAGAVVLEAGLEDEGWLG
jgi:hypothetical protein